MPPSGYYIELGWEHMVIHYSLRLQESGADTSTTRWMSQFRRRFQRIEGYTLGLFLIERSSDGWATCNASLWNHKLTTDYVDVATRATTRISQRNKRRNQVRTRGVRFVDKPPSRSSFNRVNSVSSKEACHLPFASASWLTCY